jgi:hypothetical protein
VNLIALLSRFHTTCWSRAGSPLIGPTSGSSTLVSRTPLSSAAGFSVSTAALTTAAKSTRCTSSRILPETIRDRSSRSSMIRVCVRAFRSITSTASPTSLGPIPPDRSSCE